MSKRKSTLYAVAFTGVLLFLSTACEPATRKIPAELPPPPARAAAKDRAVVLPPAAPAAVRIVSFTTEPRDIDLGQGAMLQWATENATEVVIDQGVGVVSRDGSLHVAPAATRTYTLIASGASGTDRRSATVEVQIPIPAPPPERTLNVTSDADIFEREVQDAYFDYDSSDLRVDAREILRRNAAALKRILAKDADLTVVIEGDCDERGSAEYNLGLGDRRATAAKEFLVSLGVAENRIRIISYGNERQVCNDENEACYQRNRRVHLAPSP